MAREPGAPAAAHATIAITTDFSDLWRHSLQMQRALISITVFICVILIFDMMWNDSMLTLEIYRGLRTAARHLDNAAGNLVAFLNRR